MVAGQDFALRTDPYRRELLAHCYRMLGSVHDAEDLVQETMLRAWRAADRYDDRRSSLRTWLHRIATNACLTALEQRARRPLPSGLGAPSDDPTGPMVPGAEVPWLQPIPDVMVGVGGDGGDPATVAVDRSTMRLAFVAALQHLPPRQRAMLVLRDVLAWSAAEVADALGTTTAGVNSGLQRARATLVEASTESAVHEPADAERRALVDRYVDAFERADVTGLAELLTADAVMEMPPFRNWYVGRDAYAGFMTRVFVTRGTSWRNVPTAANGQAALAAYVRGADGAFHRHTLQVLTFDGPLISRNAVFQDAAVLTAFGMPETL
jgi:RNA polymerase sigma-70 factor (ECF subfamily)